MTDSQAQRFGAYLRARRTARRPPLSQSQLAERVGVSHSTISRLEGGKVEGVDLAFLARVAPYYDLGVLAIWERAGVIPAADVAGFAALLREIAPVELARQGIAHGPWPESLRQLVWGTLETWLLQSGYGAAQ